MTHPFTALAELLASASDEALRASGECLTLGSLRDMLARCPEDMPVRIEAGPRLDRENPRTVTVLPAAPQRLDSYRGYYNRLAFGLDVYAAEGKHRLGSESRFANRMYRDTPEVIVGQPATVASVIAALDLADGASFMGYKGGTYSMDRDTLLHCAEYGSTGTMLTGLTVKVQRDLIETPIAIITTRYEEF